MSCGSQRQQLYSLLAGKTPFYEFIEGRFGLTLTEFGSCRGFQTDSVGKQLSILTAGQMNLSLTRSHVLMTNRENILFDVPDYINRSKELGILRRFSSSRKKLTRQFAVAGC